MLVTIEYITAQILCKFRWLHRDQRGDVSAQNVMWIAVGVLILVFVFGLFTFFQEQIMQGIRDIFGRGPSSG